MTRVFHDDVRKPPDESWTWARTNIQAIHFLEQGTVSEISLDHDMGGEHMDADHPRTMYFKGRSSHNGLELVRWMLAHDLVPPRVIVHSWNLEGAERMRAALEVGGVYASVVPFDPTPDEPKRCVFCQRPRHPQRTKYCSDMCREQASELMRTG